MANDGYQTPPAQEEREKMQKEELLALFLRIEQEAKEKRKREKKFLVSELELEQLTIGPSTFDLLG